MGDYSISNFSFNKGKTEYKGNKNKTFDLTKFDGVSKNELLQNVGGENTARGKLIASVFQKYDRSGDGILTQEEFSAMRNDLVRMAGDGNLGGRELKKFNENLGVENNTYSMEDLQSLVGMMVDGTDSITGVSTNGNNVTVAYNPENTDGITERVFKNGILLQQTQNAKNPPIIEGGGIDFTNSTETITYGDDGRTPVKTVIRGAGDNPPVLTKNFAADGTTLTSAELKYTDRTGNITVEYRNDLEKPTKKTTVHPDGTKEIIVYIYFPNGSVTETYENENGQTTKVVEKDSSGNETEIYTYNNDKVTLQVYEGNELKHTIENANSIEDANTKLQQELQAEQNEGANEPQTTEYQVAQGEVWYNLVAAKYNVSDHKTIMNIVHQLKESNGVNENDRTMPATLNLPNKVTVGDTVYTLDTTKAADAGLLTTTPSPVNDRAVTEAPTPSQGTDNNGDEVVATDPNHPTYAYDPLWTRLDLPLFKLNQMDIYIGDKEDRYARRIQEKYDNGTFSTFEYVNSFGGSNSDFKRICDYNTLGILTGYAVFEYDSQENCTRILYYDSSGRLIKYTNEEETFWRDPNGNKMNE